MGRKFGLFLGWRPWLVWGALLVGVLGSGGCEPRQRAMDPVAAALAPEGDTASYRRLVLPNRMKVMLVSDSATERSGAALSVAVGSLDDPEGRPGLAHFLEHMLFLGTKKYPRPGEYQAHLTSHGGFSNAYTADDHTNYFFEISHGGFEEALDRFAWFFISPLFNQEFAEREVKAVASEHSKNIENDYWRVRQVQRDTYDAGHPINRFSTGNLKTLAGVGNEELRRFYAGNYSANGMALAVVSNQTLAQLEKLVRDRFEQVQNRNLPRKTYPREFLKAKPALRLLTVEPVADQRGLAIEFPLPPTEQLYASKPLHLIGSVLGDESQGSLLSLLKAKNLATSLSAGVGESTADYASFKLQLALTPEGLERYREVLQLVLGAIEGLREGGVPRHIFEENRTMAALDFRFRERPQAGNLASQFSAQMQVYPLKTLPAVVHRFTKFDPKTVAELLERMRPGNMLVSLVAKGVETTHTQPFYQARYGYREITGAPFEALVQARPPAGWHPPRENPFIPKSVNPRPPEGALKLSHTALLQLEKAGLAPKIRRKLEPFRDRIFPGARELRAALAGVLPSGELQGLFPQVVAGALPLPQKLVETPRARVWFQPGWRFRQPRAEINLLIHTEGASASPRAAVLAELYEVALEEGLNEYAYPIRQAGLSFAVHAHRSGIQLTVGGYSATMLSLLEELARRLRRVEIGEQTFASIKERTQRSLRNARFDQPYQQARYYRRLLLKKPAFTLASRLEVLPDIRLEDLQAFAGGLYRRVYVEGVVFGSLSPQAARAALGRMLNVLESEPLPERQRVGTEVRLLALDSDYVFSEVLPVNNSFASYYYQVGPTDPRVRGALLIISRPLGEQFYFNMRTDQQLGYIVYAGMGQIKKILGLNFIVQSGTYPADELLRRMGAYIPRFVKDFARLPPEAFENFRRAVIEAKLERPNSMDEAAKRLFWIAFENEEKWDHVSRDIRAVEMLSRGEVEEILNHNLLGRGVRRLAIRLLGKDQPSGKPAGQPITIPLSAQGKRG